MVMVRPADPGRPGRRRKGAVATHVGATAGDAILLLLDRFGAPRAGSTAAEAGGLIDPSGADRVASVPRLGVAGVFRRTALARLVMAAVRGVDGIEPRGRRIGTLALATLVEAAARALRRAS